MLREIADAQCLQRESVVLRTPIRSIEQALEQEFMKGEASGMRALLALPKTFIEAARVTDEANRGDDDASA